MWYASSALGNGLASTPKQSVGISKLGTYAEGTPDASKKASVAHLHFHVVVATLTTIFPLRSRLEVRSGRKGAVVPREEGSNGHDGKKSKGFGAV